MNVSLGTKRSLNLFLQRLVIAAASIDVLLGALISAVPELVLNLFKIPLPSEMLYLRLLGLTLIGLGVAYVLGGVYPCRYFGNIAVASVIRTAMGVLLIISAVNETPLLVLGFLETLMGVVHGLYTALIGGGAAKWVRQGSRPGACDDLVGPGANDGASDIRTLGDS